MSNRPVIAALGILAYGLFIASAPASALTTVGDPDNSRVLYEIYGSSTPDQYSGLRYDDTQVNYYDPSPVSEWVTATGVNGGSMFWALGAFLEDGRMGARVSAESAWHCVNNDTCALVSNSAGLNLYLIDRFYIDQEVLDPTAVTIRLSVDGYTDQPANSGTGVNVLLNSFRNPFDGTYDSFNSVGEGFFDFTLEDTIVLQKGQQWFDVQAVLQLYVTSSPLVPGVPAVVDFSNTALWDIILPSGLTFHSESGFTGRSAAAVSEPGTLALVVLGLLAMALLLRRTRSSIPGEQVLRSALLGAAMMIALAMSSGTAHALQVIQSHFAADGVRATQAGPLQSSYSRAVNLFDPALGTLEGATFSFDGYFPLSASARFGDPDGGVGGNVALSGLSFSLNAMGISEQLDFSDRVGSCGAAPSPFNGSASCIASISRTFPISITKNAPGALLVDLIGTGTFDVTFSQNGFLSVNPHIVNDDQILSAGALLRWSGTFEIIYDYAPLATSAVPEPSTLLLIGSGCVLLALGRRRFNHSASAERCALLTTSA